MLLNEKEIIKQLKRKVKENIKLSIFQNMHRKKITQATTLSAIKETIRKGDENLSLIIAARKAKNNTLTKKVEQLIHAVAFNCYYTGNKLVIALERLTGMICLVGLF